MNQSNVIELDSENPYAVDVSDPILVEINRKLDSRVEFFRDSEESGPDAG